MGFIVGKFNLANLNKPLFRQNKVNQGDSQKNKFEQNYPAVVRLHLFVNKSRNITKMGLRTVGSANLEKSKGETK